MKQSIEEYTIRSTADMCSMRQHIEAMNKAGWRIVSHTVYANSVHEKYSMIYQKDGA